MKANIKKKYDAIRAKFVYTNTLIPQDRKELKVLIVEDHPLMQNTIALIFNELNERQKEYFFTLDMAFNCQEAYERINKNKLNCYDYILLDIHLPEFKEKKFFSGEDIGEWIKRTIVPNPKIIVITFLKDTLRIKSLLKNIKPNALLVKDEITCETLIDAVKHTIEGETYFSDSIININKNLIYDDVTIDVIDRRLLFELSLGSSMNELVEALPIGKSAIQKRKNNLMELFEVINKSNRELVLKAKQLGFL
ncbi:response regulator [uncultured Dokdonia sp.]|uniref:response regulator n=1 Tax=uncultured Dokdonia sp. TaxID=575653 RepID=UPI002605C8D9|nr:response regulator [uncultured Dokdonia sp.]